MCPQHIRLCTRGSHLWSYLFPTRSLQSGFCFSRSGNWGSEIKSFTQGHTATHWLWGLCSFHYIPWPSLPRSSRASQPWQQRVPFDAVSALESGVPSRYESALLPIRSPGPFKEGPVFLKVPKHWWWKKVRPVPEIRSKMNSAGPPANCPCPYSSAGACQGLPGMTQARVTMGDPIPFQTTPK